MLLFLLLLIQNSAGYSIVVFDQLPANITDFCEGACRWDWKILPVNSSTSPATFQNPLPINSWIVSGNISVDFIFCQNSSATPIAGFITASLLIVRPFLVQQSVSESENFSIPHSYAEFSLASTDPTITMEIGIYRASLELEVRISPPISTPTPTPGIIPTPTHTPTPTPTPLTPFSPPPQSWWREHQWIFILIGLAGLIFLVIIFCALYKYFFDEGYAPIDYGDFYINFSELSFGEKIGTGGYATVFKGKYRRSTVAIKKMNSEITEKVKREFEKEFTLLSKINKHQNILALIGISSSSSSSSNTDIIPDLCLITEYCERGSLFAIVHQPVVIEPAHIQYFCRDICTGMNYLHSLNIIHRDLKTPNLLVDRNWRIKVADFGLSKWRERSDFIQTMTACGTPAWAAPEVLSFEKYSLKADVYSFGICLWELSVRKIPFGELVAAKIIIGVATKGLTLPIPASFPELLKPIFISCTRSTPEQRPDFEELLSIFNSLSFPIPQQPSPYQPKENENTPLVSLENK